MTNVERTALFLRVCGFHRDKRTGIWCWEDGETFDPNLRGDCDLTQEHELGRVLRLARDRFPGGESVTIIMDGVDGEVTIRRGEPVFFHLGVRPNIALMVAVIAAKEAEEPAEPRTKP